MILNFPIGLLFVYRWAVMPKIPERYFTELKKIFSDFIWNEKKAKISYNELQGLKTDGGARLVNKCHKGRGCPDWILR